MSTVNYELREQEPFSRVTYAFAAAWRRMMSLMFSGSMASPRHWLMWGALAFFSGAVGGDFGSQLVLPGNFSSDERSLGLPIPIHPDLIFLVLGLGALFGVIGLYITSRMRFALLEAVLSGQPRLRGVFSATGRPGLQLFAVQLGAGVIWLALLLPVGLAAWPLVRSALRAQPPTEGAFMLLLSAAVLWALPVSVAGAAFLWWLNDLVLPIVWRRGLNIPAAMRVAARLTVSNLGAVLLMALGRFLVSIATGFLSACVACAGCCFWFPFAGGAAVLGWASWDMPAIAVLTVPLGLACALTAGWLIATLLSPVVVLRQAWAFAFVASLDPSLGDWSDPD